MKVILKEEVDNLGLAGDVVNVANGYGRNYLIPRGLAIKATKGALKEAETLTRARKARESATRDAAEEYREAIEARALRIPARVDEKGHLYGSVSAPDVQSVLKERGHEIETRRIDVGRSIKEIGEYTAQVRLHPQVTANVTFHVVDVEGNVTVAGLEEKAAAEAEAVTEESLEERAIAAAEEVEAAEDAEEAEEAEEAEDAAEEPVEEPAEEPVEEPAEDTAPDDAGGAPADTPSDEASALADAAHAPSDTPEPTTVESVRAQQAEDDES